MNSTTFSLFRRAKSDPEFVVKFFKENRGEITSSPIKSRDSWRSVRQATNDSSYYSCYSGYYTMIDKIVLVVLLSVVIILFSLSVIHDGAKYPRLANTLCHYIDKGTDSFITCNGRYI